MPEAEKLALRCIGVWLTAEQQPRREGKKTDWWVIASTSGKRLGIVQWYGAWHQYAFFPDVSTLFNAGCMSSLAEFCTAETRARRVKAA